MSLAHKIVVFSWHLVDLLVPSPERSIQVLHPLHEPSLLSLQFRDLLGLIREAQTHSHCHSTTSVSQERLGLHTSCTSNRIYTARLWGPVMNCYFRENQSRIEHETKAMDTVHLNTQQPWLHLWLEILFHLLHSLPLLNLPAGNRGVYLQWLQKTKGWIG